MSALLSQINNAAHQGAFGHNPRSEPTLAQLAAGNYKKGVVMVKGLSIAIENPAYTYRKGMDKSGKEWMCLMQAHYGYIQGHKGNDGDEMDVFIGNVPENDTVYIVNQKTADGYFDEHKIMLGFLSQQQAVDTYQHCFERGWTGLMSVVPCTMTQFKWWLANGDKSRPVTLDRLPYAGLERLDSVIWGGNDGSDLASHSGQVHKLLYQIRQCDDTHQALEPLSYNDLVQELGNQGFIYESYDALVVEYNKLEKKAKQLLMVMQGAASTVKPMGVTVGKPLTKGGVANVVAWFEMDDGQAVGVFFHNPDKTPKKIDPTDEMISCKWVLNKKDITIAVAPEQGKDLIIRTVAKRIMQLVEKNHDRFVKANGDKAALNQTEQDLTAQVADKQATLKSLQNDVAALQAKKAEKDAFNLTLQQKTDEDALAEKVKALTKQANDFGKAKDGFLGVLLQPIDTKKADKLFKEALGGEWCFTVYQGFVGVSIPKLGILYSKGDGTYSFSNETGMSSDDPQLVYQGMLDDKGYQQARLVKNLSQLLIDIEADKFSDTELLSKEPLLKDGYSLIGGEGAQESTIKAMYKTAFQKIEAAKIGNKPYSENITDALVAKYGWAVSDFVSSIKKSFSGMAAAGEMSDGTRNLTATVLGNGRWIGIEDVKAATGGSHVLETEMDMRPYMTDAEGGAKAFNDLVEAYVAKRREEVKAPVLKTTGKLSTPQELVQVAMSRKEGNKAFVELGEVTADVAQKVKDATGEDVTGWVHGLDEAAVRHILKEHGDPAVEDPRGQIAITMADIEQIDEVVNNPDSVEEGEILPDGTKTVLSKKAMNGSVTIVQEVRLGRKKLAVKTLWKVRSVPPTTAEAGLVHTSETSARNSPQTIETITQPPQSATEERPSNWRTNLANARAVAKSLGLETKGKKLVDLVGEIEKAQTTQKSAPVPEPVQAPVIPEPTPAVVQAEPTDEGYMTASNGTQYKFEIRPYNNGFGVFVKSKHADGREFDQLYASRKTEEDAQMSVNQAKNLYLDIPLPSGTYRQGTFNGKKYEGLSESTAKIEAKKRNHGIDAGSEWVVVDDSSNKGKFAIELRQEIKVEQPVSEPATPTQEDQDREFLLSAIDEKINILDAANVNKLAELSKVYTQGDMNGLIKQAKQVAIDAVKRSVANATAKMN